MDPRHDLIVYAWTPDWDTFQHLSLGDKIQKFKQFALTSQTQFLEQNNPQETICLIVAPDLVFSPPESNTYSWGEKNNFDYQIRQFQREIISQAFVIAGAIDYATEDEKQYQVTSYLLSKDEIYTYDKQSPTEDLRETYICGMNTKRFTRLTMKRGISRGIYRFMGKNIGLEICQDHEEATLLNSPKLNRERVDIHVLISAGQTRNEKNVCVGNYHQNILIQCELKPTSSSLDGIDTKTSAWQAVRKPHSSKNNSIVYLTEITMNEFEQDDVSAKHVKIILPTPIAAHLQPGIKASKRNQTLASSKISVSVSAPAPATISSKIELANIIKGLIKHVGWSRLTFFAAKPKGVIKLEKIELDDKFLQSIKDEAQQCLEKNSFFRRSSTHKFYMILANLNTNNIKQTKHKLLYLQNKLDKKIRDSRIACMHTRNIL